jgi:hypothetical protein
VRSFFEVKMETRRGGFTVLEADHTSKSSVAAGEAEGEGWHLEVKDAKGNWVVGPNARLGRTADWVDEKNMGEYEMGQKDRRNEYWRAKTEKEIRNKNRK